MHNIIHKYFDKLDAIKGVVDGNSEEILKKIDLTELLKDPRSYLRGVAKAFYEAHGTYFAEAVQIGLDESREIIKRL